LTIKHFFSFCLVLICSTGTIIGQNLFDCTHSKFFAASLLQYQSYHQATRVLMEMPDSCKNDSIKERVLFCLHQAKDLPSIIHLSQTFHQQATTKRLNNLCYFVLLKSSIIVSNVISDSLWKRCNYIIPKDTLELWKEAYSLLHPNIEKSHFTPSGIISKPVLIPLKCELELYKYKKPLIAASLSALVPGLGKAYCGKTKDAFTTFVTVGLTAFQAWRGFSQRGYGSVYGWGGLCLSSGFYLGGIYGSARTAKKINKDKIDVYRKKVINTVFHNSEFYPTY